MKKLFFPALLAVTVVGVVYAQDPQYSTEPNGQGIKFSCENLAMPTCETEAPRLVDLYEYPTDEEIDVPIEDYDLQYVEFQ